MSKLTHRQLCEISAKYLKKHNQNTIIPNCPYVAIEIDSLAKEKPDIIGFSGGMTVLIECKTSYSDFKADLNKPARLVLKGMGNLRYYICEQGIIPPKKIPYGWGLLNVLKGQIYIIKRAEQFSSDTQEELKVLYSILRREVKPNIFKYRK